MPLGHSPLSLTLTTINCAATHNSEGEQQIRLAKTVALRKEKIETLQEYAGHGFRYGGSTSQINMMQKKKDEARKLELEAEKEADEMVWCSSLPGSQAPIATMTDQADEMVRCYRPFAEFYSLPVRLGSRCCWG
jgi:hypothetical protein